MTLSHFCNCPRKFCIATVPHVQTLGYLSGSPLKRTVGGSSCQAIGLVPADRFHRRRPCSPGATSAVLRLIIGTRAYDAATVAVFYLR